MLNSSDKKNYCLFFCKKMKKKPNMIQQQKDNYWSTGSLLGTGIYIHVFMYGTLPLIWDRHVHTRLHAGNPPNYLGQACTYTSSGTEPSHLSGIGMYIHVFRHRIFPLIWNRHVHTGFQARNPPTYLG